MKATRRTQQLPRWIHRLRGEHFAPVAPQLSRYRTPLFACLSILPPALRSLWEECAGVLCMVDFFATRFSTQACRDPSILAAFGVFLDGVFPCEAFPTSAFALSASGARGCARFYVIIFAVGFKAVLRLMWWTLSGGVGPAAFIISSLISALAGWRVMRLFGQFGSFGLPFSDWCAVGFIWLSVRISSGAHSGLRG